MATKKGNTGKRYTDAQKKQILDFVAAQGRGGMSAASRKFGVSYIALKRWKDGAGGTRGRVGRPPKAKVDGRSQRKVKTALKAVKALVKQANALRRLLKGLSR